MCVFLQKSSPKRLDPLKHDWNALHIKDIKTRVKYELLVTCQTVSICLSLTMYRYDDNNNNIIIIIIIRVYLNRPELILSRGCGLAAQSWSQMSSPCLAVFGVSSFHAK